MTSGRLDPAPQTLAEVLRCVFGKEMGCGASSGGAAGGAAVAPETATATPVAERSRLTTLRGNFDLAREVVVIAILRSSLAVSLRLGSGRAISSFAGAHLP